ncbi:MAG: Crp/Fnr family transcriptional regulator [Patescibacteria group bacterium]|nr:Crp/Fnr family transcriptional regulator [Patescibacteria group bacterium]
MNQPITDKILAFFSDYRESDYAKGEVLVQAAQDPEGVSLLLEGAIEQYDITPEGNKVTVNTFRPLSFFPMSWAINGTPNQYFYAAMSPVKLKRVEADKAVVFLHDNPDVTFDLLSRVYKGTDALLQRLVITASGIASRRLLFELLLESYRFGEMIDDTTRVITIKQHVLAARSGLARETVSREIHKLANEGLITLQGHTIQLDTQKLASKLDMTI